MCPQGDTAIHALRHNTAQTLLPSSRRSPRAQRNHGQCVDPDELGPQSRERQLQQVAPKELYLSRRWQESTSGLRGTRETWLGA